MLYAARRAAGGPRRSAHDGRPRRPIRARIWQRFASHYYLFRGTPTGAWFDHELHDLFGVREKLTAETASAHLRPDRRATCVAGIPSARAVRALQHRGARDDRQGDGLPRAPSRDSGIRMARDGSFPPSGPTRSFASRVPRGARSSRPARPRSGQPIRTMDAFVEALDERRAYFIASARRRPITGSSSRHHELCDGRGRAALRRAR